VVLQPNGDATSEFYDLVDQPVETFILPAGSTSSSTDEQTIYDNAGNVVERVDFDGRLEQAQYDGADRMVQSTDIWTSTRTRPR
jgi:YD repeat-containing protein